MKMVLRAVTLFTIFYISIQVIEGLHTLREVKFVGGKAGASSVISTSSNYQASNAFLQGSSAFWHSGRSSTGTGNLYHYGFPHTIWYQFPKTLIPARVSFKARPKLSGSNGCGNNGCEATKYQIVASNDPQCNQYSKWTVVCEDLSGQLIKNINSESKYCTVNEKMRESFTCVGISVLEGAWKSGSEVSINGIRMWARE